MNKLKLFLFLLIGLSSLVLHGQVDTTIILEIEDLVEYNKFNRGVFVKKSEGSFDTSKIVVTYELVLTRDEVRPKGKIIEVIGTTEDKLTTKYHPPFTYHRKEFFDKYEYNSVRFIICTKASRCCFVREEKKK